MRLRRTATAASARIALPRLLAVASLLSGTLFFATPSVLAGNPVAITVSGTPNPVSTGQSFAYTIDVADTGGLTASSLTLTDSLSGLGIGSFASAPYITSNTGTCSYSAPTVTCTASSLAAGQVWVVSITGQVTAAAGTSISDTATVTGTENASPFSASASTSVPVNSALPAGFTQTTLASGISKPIDLAFAPNGDIYIATQPGLIRVFRNGALLSTPLVTLPNVYYNTECGLLGIALDPNFASNGYIYVSWVVNVTNSSGVTNPYSRLSRFTVVNGAISLASEKVFYQGNQIQNGHHPGQTVKIGPDGKLWWSVGDNVPSITNAQTLTNIYGKFLRFNLDGSVPSDNPYLGVAGAIPYIWAYGLRNPFRWDFLPNGEPITEDTGSSYWEELDAIQKGGNYGWDFYEGNAFTSGFINPAYAYGHYAADGAASAVAVYHGSTFPSKYNNVVFFGDYNRRTIDAVTFDSSYTTETSDTVFDSSAGTIADLEEGPDGNLYFVSIFEGTFSKIAATGPFAPTAAASASPNAGVAPLTVQLSSAGSSDAYGAALTYSWDFGDGSGTSTAANPTHTYAANGTYTATLTVSNGHQTGTATTQVVVGTAPPTVSISAPATYNAGQTVNFSGSATDPLDGSEPPNAYTWQVDFYANGLLQPSYVAGVAFPFYGPVTGISSGSIRIPTDPSQTPNSFYRITLTVTDSAGLQTVATQDVHPNTTSWTAGTNVAGAAYAVDGTWQTGGYSTTDVVGARHVATGVWQAQTIGGTRYRFAGWADGSALNDAITGGSGAGNYTANYDAVTSAMPAPWQSVDVGNPLMAGTADYSASSGTFYLDGAGADVYGANEQFHYVYQTLAGDGTIVARVRYQSNSSPWAKAGLIFTQSTAAGTTFVDALVAPDVSSKTPNVNGVGCDANGCISPLQPVTPAMGNGARMQYTSTGSITPKSYPTGFASPNKWLMLQKSGTTFTGWMSSDGVSWTKIGSTTSSMTGPVDVGLFDTAHNIGQYSTVAFDNVSVTTSTTPPSPSPSPSPSPTATPSPAASATPGTSASPSPTPSPSPSPMPTLTTLPSPWADTDVGAVGVPGSASYSNGAFTVNGSGSDIWGTSDQFNYLYQNVSGNGTLIARVTSQSNTGSSNSKAGLIWKASTASGSPYFLIAVNNAGVVKVQWNFNTSVQATTTYAFPNVWMKMVRSNATFTAYLSPDGVTWTQVASTTLSTIPTAATLGLAECSHVNTVLGTAIFDNVSFTPGP